MTDETPSAAQRLREATRQLFLIHGALDQVKRPCGTPLSMPHAYALLELRQAGAMSVSELSKRLSIDRTNVSRLCLRMQERGELVRGAHPRDGRAVLVHLTPKGEQAASAVDAASANHFQRVLASLGGDADAVIDALDRLTDALRRTSTPKPEEDTP